MANAFGIAGTYAPMPAQTNWNSQPDRYSLVKYFSTGWSAQVGLSSALLAAEGFTGPLHILDGETGFWRMQGFDECDFDFMLEQLGHRWWIEETSFKLWPACRAVHPYLTAFAEIIRVNGLTAADIDEVVAYGHLAPPPTPGAAHTHAPRFGDPHPREPINMQFNLPHPLACIAHYVEPGPRFFAPEIVDSPAIRAFRDKVRMEVDPKSIETLQAQFSGPNPRRARKVPVTVEVKAKGGLYRRSVEYSKGDPWSPETVMDDNDLRAKFVANASAMAVASSGWRMRIDEIFCATLALEQFADINALTRMLAP
jgi:2-methylcitrate dehydratase PrpD